MSILFPVFVMALITFLISPFLLTTRISSVRKRIVRMKYYEVFQGGEPPTNVLQTTKHWSNLFEAPTLFYVACLMAVAIQFESALLTNLAWAYVVIRVVHSVIHLTYNKVYHRLAAFLTSQAILMVMWAILFLEVMSK